MKPMTNYRKSIQAVTKKKLDKCDTFASWDRIQNPAHSEVWQLVLLLLRQIVGYTCATTTTAVPYLQVLIDEYISVRADAFPQYHLRPKHNYLCHYPELILKFGPIIHLWTNTLILNGVLENDTISETCV